MEAFPVPYMCWVCGKLIPETESRPDQYGFFAHEIRLHSFSRKRRNGKSKER
jgi:hypothetical protein